MTITYRTAGAWGAGQGADLTAAQVDNNFYDLVQQIATITADLPDGVLIDATDPVDVSGSFFKFNMTDGSQSEPIPLPVATFSPAGEWTNSTPYARYNVITARKFGTFLVLRDHVTPPPPATFNPAATDGSGNPLYQLLAPYLDVNYDISVSVPGPTQRSAGDLLAQVAVVRAFHVLSGAHDAFAYLDVANAAGGANIEISIENNRVEIGTIIFVSGGADTDGGQPAALAWPADVYFLQGDIIGFRVVSSDDAAASDLVIGIPGVRDDQ